MRYKKGLTPDRFKKDAYVVLDGRWYFGVYWDPPFIGWDWWIRYEKLYVCKMLYEDEI